MAGVAEPIELSSSVLKGQRKHASRQYKRTVARMGFSLNLGCVLNKFWMKRLIQFGIPFDFQMFFSIIKHCV